MNVLQVHLDLAVQFMRDTREDIAKRAATLHELELNGSNPWEIAFVREMNEITDKAMIQICFIVIQEAHQYIRRCPSCMCPQGWSHSLAEFLLEERNFYDGIQR
jgi:hypothetical protein